MQRLRRHWHIFFLGYQGGADSHRLATHSAIRRTRLPGARGTGMSAQHAQLLCHWCAATVLSCIEGLLPLCLLAWSVINVHLAVVACVNEYALQCILVVVLPCASG